VQNSNFPNLLKSKIIISDVIGKSVRLIRRGKYRVACCPFHSEKTPSFYVNDERGSYHCFGCGAHGDVFNFIMQRDGLGFGEAVKRLAEENGMELPQFSEQEREKYRKVTEQSDIIYNINENSCNFFQNYLLSPGGTRGLEYIKGRGLSRLDIEKFRIGFAPNSFDCLINHLKGLGLSEEDMITAGVVARNERMTSYDKFRNRIMFPVFGDSGKVIAFSGRVIEQASLPKYMNSPETPIFHKSDVLFNYFSAKKSIVASRSAILVEGNMDALALHSRGVENVVSPMGTAVTQQQMEKLWRIADEIVVCFDGDRAGQNASKRLALMVLPMMAADRSLKIVSLPENRDPDDMMRLFGRDYFLKFLGDRENSAALSEFLWTAELREIGLSPDSLAVTPEQRSRLESILDKITESIGNRIVYRNFKNFYKNKLFLLGKSENYSRASRTSQVSNYRSVTNIDHRKSTVPPNSTENLKNSIINIEKYMFCLLITDISLAEKVFKSYNVDVFAIDFLSHDAGSIISIISKMLREERASDKNFLYATLEKNGLGNYIPGSSNFEGNSAETDLEYLYSLILERSKIVLEIEIRELALRNDDETRRRALTKELEAISERRNSLNDRFLR
jgi:DNA primase